jgi:hypothetical protein
MNIRRARIAPSPYEEFVIDTILENKSGQENLLEIIQQFTEERNTLRLRLAQHPQSDQAAAHHLYTINRKLTVLWAEVRRVRAARRVQLEEALGIDPSLVAN